MRKTFCNMAIIMVACTVGGQQAYGVTPNPLQDAYWRFEEGTATQPVGAPNSVIDSANLNDLESEGVKPIYTSTVAPLPLRSGLTNSVALDFTPNGNLVTAANDDTSTDRIQNGMIGPTVAPNITGFTLEAAFRADVVGGAFQGIVGKNGKPPQGNEATLALKIRGDSGNLQVELVDLSGVRRDVQSTAALTAGQWYAAAAVNDGNTLSLYLNDGSGYVLQGTTPVAGALYQGATGNDWDQNWTIGRSAFGGNAADYFDGIIDEVRLSNEALAPSEFLFVPEPGALTLAALAIGGCASGTLRRRRRA